MKAVFRTNKEVLSSDPYRMFLNLTKLFHVIKLLIVYNIISLPLSLKNKFKHNLLTLNLFQTSMNCLLLLNEK